MALTTKDLRKDPNRPDRFAVDKAPKPAPKTQTRKVSLKAKVSDG